MTVKATYTPYTPAVTVKSARVVVEEKKVTPAQEEVITLSMDRKTAEVLARVMANVGGKAHGPRGLMDNIASELRLIGIEKYGQDQRMGDPSVGCLDPENRTIHFR